jgi:hypothetical protein
MFTGVLNKDDSKLEATDTKRKLLFYRLNYIMIIASWKLSIRVAFGNISSQR